MRDDLERAFHARMLALCDRAERECAGFHPGCLRRRIDECGGLRAAQELVEAENAPGGFVRLWELGRLDLSVEREIQRPEWDLLFDDAQRARAAERLARYGHAVGAAVAGAR